MKYLSHSLMAVSAALMGFATQAHAQMVPQGASPISNALDWIQGTLMGKVATTVAVIAVAAVGFMMLTGRMNWRFGATVIVGCFILFGAATIVGGIQAVAN
ncbi:MAG: TrbC/VirB2 family protein [Asticcacaulis sp.]|uniref:TrbC/VirB2 family protein n=1 Tax=Asticcacaulis sp. TaxID=1872648 RepID=UPI0039E46C53